MPELKGGRALSTLWVPTGASLVDTVGKNPLANTGDESRGFAPWVRRIPWRRKWQPTPVCLPGEFHGQGSLAGYSL